MNGPSKFAKKSSSVGFYGFGYFNSPIKLFSTPNEGFREEADGEFWPERFVVIRFELE